MPEGDQESSAGTGGWFSGRGSLAFAAAGSLLLLMGSALPWAGWYGLNSVGPAFAMLGAGALAAWSTGVRHAHRVALVAGAAGAALLGVRLVVPPSDPFLSGIQSSVGLAIALCGALVTLVGAALAFTDRLAPSAPVADPSTGSRRAVRSAVIAVAASRVAVWVAGVGALVIFGVEESITRPPHTLPFGELGDHLVAPAVAWDADSYLRIARTGYASESRLQAFFPLYPTLLRFGAWSPTATIVAGIAVSLAAFAAALYLLHRLVVLELDSAVADRTVMLVAFSPMGVFFSALYTESLFLLLTVGAFYAARRGAWAWAGLAGGLAAATRPTGLVLLVPLLALSLRGPRGGREGLPAGSTRAHGRRPRLRPASSTAWLLMVPGGLLAYLGFCAAHGDALAPMHAQAAFWGREFAPLEGAVRGVRDSWRSLRELMDPGNGILPTPSPETGGQLSSAANLALANLTDMAFLAAAVGGTVGAFRRLPVAYGLYAAATIAMVASTFYSPHEPLASVPRFVAVLFPLYIWLALHTATVRRYRTALVVSGLLMTFFAARFATWHWVA